MNTSFSTPTRLLLISSTAIALFGLAIVVADPRFIPANAKTSFGQNSNKQSSKINEQYTPREPSLSVPPPVHMRGGSGPGGPHLLQAEADVRAGRNAAAVPEFKEAIKQQPDAVAPRYGLAVALAADGKLRDAIDEYKKVIELAFTNDEKIKTHYNLGNVYADLHEFDRAIESYREAIKIDPTLSKPHYNLALAYVAIEKTSEAAAEFAEAARLKPSYAEAHYNLGVTYLRLGKKDEAREQQQALASLDAKLAAKLEALITR